MDQVGRPPSEAAPPEGTFVSLDYGFESFAGVAEAMDRRQRFVAAGSLDLAKEIVSALD
jgi:myo-inositol-1(or 4)-monophosphatase